MKTILVTGGAGFIGSHTCVELLSKGLEICIIDSLINSSEKTISSIREIIKKESPESKCKLFFRKGDLKDKKFLLEVFNEFNNNKKKFDAVIHFAGLKSVEESAKNPLLYWDNNLNITLRLLEVMEEFNCNTLVFSSSATIYKPLFNNLLNEHSLKEPINPYGKTKLTIENILADLYVKNPDKWKIVNLRYFNPVGAHRSGLIGDNPLNKPTNLFPIILKVANGEYENLSIYGKDWPTSDGTCVRDYIHIMDLAKAHLAALEFLIQNKPQIISLNIGTGKGTSVLEIVNQFEKVNNVQVPYIFNKRRDGDPPYLVSDNKLALDLLNWMPEKDVNEMCKDSWSWSQRNINFGGYK